jgi:hypothetical protein
VDKKLLLFSVIIAMIAIPLVAAREKSPWRSLQRVLVFTLLFNLFYLFCVRFIYPRL